jgi:hypothetical protein
MTRNSLIPIPGIDPSQWNIYVIHTCMATRIATRWWPSGLVCVSPFAPLAQPNSPFAMVNDLRPRPWRYLYAETITENGVAAEGVDTGRSIKEVEMYLTGLSYREVLERALGTLAGISSHLIRNRKRCIGREWKALRFGERRSGNNASEKDEKVSSDRLFLLCNSIT